MRVVIKVYRGVVDEVVVDYGSSVDVRIVDEDDHSADQRTATYDGEEVQAILGTIAVKVDTVLVNEVFAQEPNGNF